MGKEVVGLLEILVIKGTNLAVRDLKTSDPYVVIRLADQTVKTKVIKNNLNPVWNEELSISIPKSHNLLLKLEVFDKDVFGTDDKMGKAEIDVEPLAMAVKMQKLRNAPPTDAKVSRLEASKNNCLAKDSCIHYVNGKMVQNMCLKLQNVECGEVELELKWVELTN
eukprot:Gb_20871 [translate_table: standard]